MKVSTKRQYTNRLKRAGTLALALLFSVSALQFVLSEHVTAFSAAGSGTVGDPYQITSCAEWQEINDELSAHYILMNDINCSADGNDITIGDQVLAFMGVLDGNNNQVTIDINDLSFPYDVAGLFNYLGGEVRNLEITGSITTQSSTGALAGYAEYSTVDNVHITADVEGTSNTGGMIGESNNTNISNSSVTGNVVGANSTGGIVGYAESSAFSDLRFNGDVTTNGSAGGIVGELSNGSLTRVGVLGAITSQYVGGGLVGFIYSADNISQSFAKGSVEGDFAAGGLVGDTESNMTITDSYSRSNVAGTGGFSGGILGYTIYSISITNAYSSGIISGMHEPAGLVANPGVFCTDSFWDARGGLGPANDRCSAYGATSRQPTSEMKNKFLYTSHPDRTASWNFNSIWGINPEENDGYPFLRWEEYTNNAPGDQDPIPDAVENAGPNSGDANYNEIPDAEEGHVISLPSTDHSKYITLTLNEDSCYFSSVSVNPEEDLPAQDSAYHYPGGIVSFTAQCPSPGMELTVGIMLFDFDLNNAEVRKFDTNSETYSTVNDTVHVNQVDSTRFHYSTYSISDGGPLDMDGAANGTIVDPVGIGQKITANNPDDSSARDPESDSQPSESSTLQKTGTDTAFIIMSALSIICATALIWAMSRMRHIS